MHVKICISHWVRFCSACLLDAGSKLRGRKIPHEQQIKFFGKVTVPLVHFHFVVFLSVFPFYCVLENTQPDPISKKFRLLSVDE